MMAAKAVAGREGRDLAKDVLERQIGELERFKRFAETALVIHQPRSAEQLEKDQDAENRVAATANRKPMTLTLGSWDLFGEWYDRLESTTVDIATLSDRLARYQSPQIRAVDAPTAAPELEEDEIQTIELRVFEGGRALPKPEAA